MLVAVTGANGFVGKNLVNHLKKKGFKVKPIIRDKKNNNLHPDTEWKNVLEGVEILIHCASRVHIMKENIENFNKKALYILIREMTGSNTQHITRIINVMKKYNTRLKYEFFKYGMVDLSKSKC